MEENLKFIEDLQNNYSNALKEVAALLRAINKIVAK